MKRFLKILLVLTALIAVIASVAGCESEPPDIDASDLIGRWTRLYGDGTETYLFTKDMKFTETISAGGDKTESRGTYEVSGNMLILTFGKSESTVEHKVRFPKSNKMQWVENKIPTEYIKE